MSSDSASTKNQSHDPGVSTTDVERSVIDRYTSAAEKVEPALCCADKGYDPILLKNLPEEIIAKDYGCGDPSPHVHEGDAVVDLGSGSGKMCYMLAQKVGPDGQIIGVDFNDAMLTLARQYEGEVAKRIGHANVRFVKARIQDMALDMERAQRWLQDNPINSIDRLDRFEEECARLRREEPAVADGVADVVISNCVLNLVRPEDKKLLFGDIFRVLKRGGRAVISDIVCDEDPTPRVMNDPHLWSDCISGAFREDRFLEHFEQAGFYGVEVLVRQEQPWQVIDGVEYRSVTVRAFKGKEGPSLERNQAVIYRGPWKTVHDDDGHTLSRGKRMAVCDKTFGILTNEQGPYGKDIIAVPPSEEIPIESAVQFACNSSTVRDPRQTKGTNYAETGMSEDSPCCESEGCC